MKKFFDHSTRFYRLCIWVPDQGARPGYRCIGTSSPNIFDLISDEYSLAASYVLANKNAFTIKARSTK